MYHLASCITYKAFLKIYKLFVIIYCKIETLNLKDLKDLKLTANESKYIIKFIAKKRSTTTKKILETINKNQKCRINKKLTEKQQKLTEAQQKLIETQQKLIKAQQKNTIN